MFISVSISNVALGLYKDFYYLILGEMETDEPDDESSQDQELPSENENSQSEDSVGGDNDSEMDYVLKTLAEVNSRDTKSDCLHSSSTT